MAEDTDWFWRIVDANGPSGLPSDEVEALRMLVEKAGRLDLAKKKLAEIDALAADMEKSKEPGEHAHGILILDITRDRHNPYCGSTIAKAPGPCDCGLADRLGVTP